MTDVACSFPEAIFVIRAAFAFVAFRWLELFLLEEELIGIASACLFLFALLFRNMFEVADRASTVCLAGAAVVAEVALTLSQHLRRASLL